MYEMEADPVQRPVLPSLFRPTSMHPPKRPPRFNAFSAVPPRRMSLPDAVRRSGIPASPSPSPSPAAALEFAREFQHLPFQRLKFVANDGQPHAKRRRIAAACGTCRKRKTRCSGEKPFCETCKQNRHECMGYAEQKTKGSSQPTWSGVRDNNANAAKGDSTRMQSLNPGASEEPRTSGSSTPRAHQRHIPQPVLLPRDLIIPTRMESPEYLTSSCTPEREVKRKFGEQEAIFRRTSSPAPSIQLPEATQQSANRIPYFRYFGPTAIAPGFKRVVVEVRKPGPSSQSVSSASSVGSPAPSHDSTSTHRAFEDGLPLYDPDELGPVPPLIFHLVDIFFTHVGCNFPFLRKEIFKRDLQEKNLDALLVHAVCAVSARFSTHPLLKTKSPSTAGVHFSDRAKELVVDTFACPSLSAVQALLLLAYAEFGSNRDSGLWMFLGLAVRMAQDLGLHKLAGMRANGEKLAEDRRGKRSRSASADTEAGTSGTSWEAGSHVATDHAEEDGEQERTDTFWAIYFLDRVVSSGTGRPVTLKDAEIELKMPSIEEPVGDDAHPCPFPVLIRIIYLYGNATDILNNSTSHSDRTSDETAERLRQLDRLAQESQALYDQLSPKLYFNVANFQHYVMVNQSSVFMLLHSWFHALIVLLRRPSVLTASGDETGQLNELSISSAETIANIFAFAGAIDRDLKSVIGNPFNSQPLYIAACAFLQESAACGLISRRVQLNYQRCHKALRQIEPCWEGVKYILAVVDQKAEGIVDPLLYIPDEESESIEIGQWGRKVWSLLKRHAIPDQRTEEGSRNRVFEGSRASPEFPNEAIGVSMTGFTDSANAYNYRAPEPGIAAAFPLQMSSQQRHPQLSPYAESNPQTLSAEPSLHSNIGAQFQPPAMDSQALAEVIGAGGYSLEAGVVDMGVLGAEMNDWFSLEYMPHGGDAGMGSFYGEEPRDGRH